MSFSIDGKTVIVTGAANGIGAALARHFAENDAKVMCADIDEKALKTNGLTPVVGCHRGQLSSAAVEAIYISIEQPLWDCSKRKTVSQGL